MTEPTFREPVAAPLTTMLTMVQDEYGEAERVLRPERIDRPSLGDGEVLVRVSAAGVDRGVWHQVGRSAVSDPPGRVRAAGAEESGSRDGRGRPGGSGRVGCDETAGGR